MLHEQICRFGLFVNIDMSEVRTSSAWDNSSGKQFAIHIGHHMPRSTNLYNVILPSSAFTESVCLFVNLLGMVQKTYKSTQPLVMDAYTIQTSDVVLFSVVRYIILYVSLPCGGKQVDCVTLATEQYKRYLPYALNRINDMDVCSNLLHMRITRCGIRDLLYVGTVRSNYATDIVTSCNNVLHSVSRSNR